MGFGSVMKKIGKGALKVGKVAVPLALAATGVGIPAAVAASAALNAADKKASGGSWKQALISGGIGAGTSLIPGAGGVAGSVGSNVAKAGLKEIAKGVAKGAATNFATGAGTSLATGQGLKKSLAAGASAAGEGGLGTGGIGTLAKTVGKNVAVGAGGQLAAKGLTKAGVPGAAAQQGGNVFSNYLGGKLNSQPASTGGAPAAGGGFGASARPAAPGGFNWRGTLLTSGVGLGANALANTASGGSTTIPSGNNPIPTSMGQIPATTSGGQIPRGSNPIPTSTGLPQPVTGQRPTAPSWTPPAQQQQQQQQTGQPASWQERWGPILTQAGGIAAGAVVGQQAQKNAMKRSPEEQAALTGATGAAGDLGRYGKQAWNQGQQTLDAPGQYFRTLLSGNRAAMSQAIAGPAAQLTGNYRGAQRALDQQGVRGAARDVAVADLNRDRVSKIAGLTTGMQPYAAEQLKSMGETQQALAPGMLGASGSLYGNLLGQGSINRQYARSEGEKTATAIGGLARDAGEVVFKKGQKAPATNTTSTTKPQAGAAQPPPPMPVKAPPPTGYPSTNIPMPNFGTKSQVWAY